MNYPQWWERLLAAIVDGIIFVVVSVILGLIFGALAGPVGGGIISGLITTGLVVAYKVFFESGQWQATPGKMVFGLTVVDDTGNRLPMQQAFFRTWPWWLNLIVLLAVFPALQAVLSFLILLALIVIFLTFFTDPVGRCLHDQTAKANVIKTGKGMIQT